MKLVVRHSWHPEPGQANLEIYLEVYAGDEGDERLGALMQRAAETIRGYFGRMDAERGITR